MGPASSETRADRADDVLALARLAGEPESVRAILAWLSRRTGGLAALVGPTGTMLATAEPAAAPAAAAPAAAAAAVELRRRGAPSAVLGGEGGRAVHLVRLGPGGALGAAAAAAGEGEPPYLTVVGPDDPRCGVLLADAARTLALCWRLEEAERARRRVESAEAHSREAVLHLLMVGSVPAAQRIAGALGPALPALARVYVVEGPGHRRPEIAGRIDRVARGRAWIVPCPVRSNHLIALVPPGPEGEGAEEPKRADGLARLIARQVPECRVGASAEHPLRDTPVGYEQAFHALAVARGAPQRYAGFGRHTDITALASPEARRWARELLGPCLRYVPPRRADPGAQELLGTLGSWLSFGGAANRHLKIHRNTLAARIRLIGDLLGLDIGHSLAGQSAAWLALRLHGAPHGTAETPAEKPPAPASLDALLSSPAAGLWARAQLRPLDEAGPAAVPETVRAWLRADARLPAAAAALGISLPGARKRLARAEEVLGRSLLRAPSAKYELWLAVRASGSL
ncbi:PucR family transcriptional regulator [Streptomyces sp. ME19-01-6]|uniref:PucR family transcriptional regulator n=1 Tax=Streptomyces sp. ME19-01-6 TaxID=3028686 RepID=UPI0029B8EA46|nr:helix-turn-helix domain-containing protein [Streptomyces sp. ME19-01-6]MDX3225986.1 helix-turn-helix domain-containing protein [Streptomyces sp. ME19-01-6]